MASLSDLPGDLRRAAKAVADAGTAANLAVARATQAEAVRRSSGTATYSDLRRADHPFAKRHGSPLWDASTINSHRADGFRAYWLVEPHPRTGRSTLFVLRNDSPIAGFLENGTQATFSRPLAEILRRFAESEWSRVGPPLIESALRNALSK